jgi:hypothetical protein
MNTIDAISDDPTPASARQAVSGTSLGDELLNWPPDLSSPT